MMPIGYPNIRFDTTVPDNDGIERHQPLSFSGGARIPGWNSASPVNSRAAQVGRRTAAASR